MDSFHNNQISLIPDKTLRQYLEELNKRYPELPRQLIHRDLHLGNLLFENGTLSCYIDFDLCQINARIFDLCYMALGFLSNNVSNPSLSEIWFSIFENMLKGYTAVLPVSSEEKEAIPCVMVAIELLFIAFFANHKNESRMKDAAAVSEFIIKNRVRLEAICA